MSVDQQGLDLAQIAFVSINLIGLSVIAFAIGHKVSNDSLTSLLGWHSLTWMKCVILSIFLDSWLYLFASGLLVNGIGLELNYAACATAITLCVAFYSTSKMLVYVFLSERVYVVWSAGTSTPRRKSTAFQLCMLILLAYAVIMAFMFVGRVIDSDRNSSCQIGLHEYVSIIVLSFDLFVNVFLTSLFVIPIWKVNFTNLRLRIVSRRTTIASAISLTTSSVNMALLTAYHGREAGWLCLSTCSLDVAVNAIAILWATSGVSEEAESHLIKLPHISNAISITSAFREGYSLAPGSIDALPKSVQGKLCPGCFSKYPMDEPNHVSEMKRWEHAATLPLELEAGNRGVRSIGSAPLDLPPDDIDCHCPNHIPHIYYSPFPSFPSNLIEEK